VRKKGYDDTSDYNDKFLRQLNKAVKAGLAESLFHEKLGWNDQRWAYMQYTMYFTCMTIINPENDAILFIPNNIAINLMKMVGYQSYEKTAKEHFGDNFHVIR